MIELAGELICVSEEEVAAVREHLPEHVRLTLEEPGCMLFEVLPVGGGVWTVLERFTDLAAFEAHQVRTQGSAWFAATGAIKRRYEVREVAAEVVAEPEHEHHDHHDHHGHTHDG